jgi:hypothetical protein
LTRGFSFFAGLIDCRGKPGNDAARAVDVILPREGAL